MVSKYFNRFPKNGNADQRLYENLINESIHINGCDAHYIFRESRDAELPVIGEDPSSKFEKKHIMEMYIENTDHFDGPGDMLEKFGMITQNFATAILSSREWNKNIDKETYSRPREGDLIYFEIFNCYFEIVKVDNEEFFYSFGRKNREQDPYAWKLSLELFHFSNEKINTGDEMIDNINETNPTYIVDLSLTYGTDNFIIGETINFGGTSMLELDGNGVPLMDNSNNFIFTVNSDVSFSENTAIASAWNNQTKVLSLTHIQGVPQESIVIRGLESNSWWVVANTEIELLGRRPKFDSRDNREIQQDSNSIIITTESNPFGLP